MDKPGKKLLRCAIYTRKSTDHNLDLEFNSLDAQREACEAYIKSQAHEGWRLIHDRYDDGAFSGASLDRPALQRLLTEVGAGKIDIIVVYKVDRLTRSLGDFAKLVELFDQHSVSFVSVTQSFNTTSSMGRLTLNVLLSFAQFEREVIGERVRDKIAASKAKGIWVGGSVPLGYASVNKKLVVVPKEAETVRLIFRRYLELGSIRDLVEDLDHKGIRTRRQVLSTGKIRGSIRFGVGPLAHLLRNRFYIGEIVYRGAVHPGEQEHILDRALFDAVQAKLDASASARHLKLRASPSILSGRIFDDGGNRMTPTHTNKQGARYRYFVSHAILQKRGGEAGSVVRISAPDIETAVVQAVRNHLDKRKSGDRPNPTTDRELIERHVERIIVKPQMIEVHLVSEAGHGPAEHDQAIVAQHLSETAAPVAITVPWTMTAIAAAKGILHSPLPSPAMSVDERDVILTAIAKARAWIADLIEGRATSFAEISQREGKVERHIRLLAPLAFVSPGIIADIIDGILPSIAITDLAKQLPYCWARQEIGSQLDLRSAG
jgi:DNA invertase Pin-like site-specific DNA recombinase